MEDVQTIQLILDWFELEPYICCFVSLVGAIIGILAVICFSKGAD